MMITTAKFVVAQIGARRTYAVPQILEKAGMLERFYTNVAGNVGIASLAATVAGFPLVPEAVARLAQRRVPKDILEKTVTFARPGLELGFRRALGSRDRAAAFRNAVAYSNSLGRAMVRQGLGNATHVYSMLGECGPLLAAAKQRGLKVVSEVYILLSTERILTEERRENPGWEPDLPDFATLRRELGERDVLLECSDHFICPSAAVRDDLVDNFHVKSEQTSVVPYGVGPEWFTLQNEPQRGRILFAGTADLRKGIHYLARAAEVLTKGSKGYDFRVAGNVTRTIAEKPECRNLTFLGRISRAQLKNEFQSADVFVLPSLAEGSPEVIYEALAAGLPVVTTSEAGSVVRDGIEGRIVRSRDPDALAVALHEVVEDRGSRWGMAVAARKRALDYTWERYGERLIVALSRLDTAVAPPDS